MPEAHSGEKRAFSKNVTGKLKTKMQTETSSLSQLQTDKEPQHTRAETLKLLQEKARVHIKILAQGRNL